MEDFLHHHHHEPTTITAQRRKMNYAWARVLLGSLLLSSGINKSKLKPWAYVNFVKFSTRKTAAHCLRCDSIFGRKLNRKPAPRDRHDDATIKFNKSFVIFIICYLSHCAYHSRRRGNNIITYVLKRSP